MVPDGYQKGSFCEGSRARMTDPILQMASKNFPKDYSSNIPYEIIQVICCFHLDWEMRPMESEQSTGVPFYL